MVQERLWTTGVSALIASIPALMLGYTFAFPSSALLDLTEDDAGLPKDYRFSIELSEVFGALAPIGAIFGAPVSGTIADKWGRKTALIFSGLPYIIGYLILSYAHYLPTALSFKALALTGRFITGVGMGWAGSVGPVYIGEISSARLRGVFGAFTQVAVATGLLLNYAISSIPNFPYYYNSLVAVGIIAVFECLSVVWLYETPRWLVRKGMKQRAIRVLQWLRGPLVKVESEVESIELAEDDNVWRALKDVSKRYIIVPTVIVMVAMFFHQIGGAHVLSTYAAVLYEQAGVPSPKITATYAVGGAELIATVVSVFVIDLIGRKPLLIFSGIGMFVGSGLLGAHYYITHDSQCTLEANATLIQTTLLHSHSNNNEFANCINTQFSPLAITSTIVFAVSYSIGWGPVPWVLLSELIPVRIRGIASGTATMVNWASAALVIGIYFQFSEVGEWYVWWTFSAFNAVAVVFTVVFVRETKGKTLEDIEKYYQEHWC